MKIGGVICEYNPLHQGHHQQLGVIKQRCDYVVCLMSGSFVQRGEPAMFDKFVRARWALLAGADAVFELPTIFSLQSAQGFARGGVQLLSTLGVDELYFGSECEQRWLEQLLSLSPHQQGVYDTAFRHALDQGLSYAAAKQQAAQTALPDAPASLFERNAVLGLEYLQALREANSRIMPIALPRQGTVSASALRASLLRGELCLEDVPAFVADALPSLTPVTLQSLEGPLLYRLRCMTQEDFQMLPGMSDGLENRLYQAAQQSTSLEGLLDGLRIKRIPLARIKRSLCHALLGITEGQQRALLASPPTHLRLLGLREASSALMGELSRRCALPIGGRPQEASASFSLDVRATDLRALGDHHACGQDYTTRLVTV